MIRTRPGTALGTALLVLVSAPAAADSFAEAREVLASLHASTIDTSGPLRVDNVRLRTGFADLRLHTGLLFPVLVDGAPGAEWVFVGSGTVKLDPPDDVEAGQLELFTGAPHLDEQFSEAVLVVARDAAARKLLERPPAAGVPPEVVHRAAELHGSWRSSPSRRHLDVEAALFADLLGEPASDGYFGAWFRGNELGDFLLLVDPTAQEQLTVGQFVKPAAGDKGERALARLLHREQKRGRLIGLELDDLGVWDTWVASTRRAADGAAMPGRSSFEPRHYDLEVTVKPHSRTLSGHGRIELRAVSGGCRIATLSLHRDLSVEGLTAGGDDLFYFREGTEIHVVLPEAPDPESVVELEMTWSGDFLDKGGDRNWALRDGLAWYPHAGQVDRATYDVTLRWPRKYDLVASGLLVETGDHLGLRWERRQMRQPSVGFSFEVGRFRILPVRAGHVSVTVAFDPSMARFPSRNLAEISATVTDSLAFYEQVFGPYPLDRLTVVTVPRDYSQAMLGFITLSSSMMVDWGSIGAYFGFTDRRMIVAHEVAHQWWGHQVGWVGYRDQWISEAMANYSSQLWARRRLTLEERPHRTPTTGWQARLTATLADGRPIESLGPLVLGHRLFSSRSADAYQAIVYRKGALVLEMLARNFGEDLFVRLLGALVEAVRGQVLSTEDFLTLLERLSSTDLAGFAESFIYGTGLPEIFYDFEVEDLGTGRWQVRLTTRRESGSHFRFVLVERSPGRFDVERRLSEGLPSRDTPIAVPFQLVLDDGQRTLNGQLLITGSEEEQTFELDARPEELWLDPEGQVYALFFNQRLHPKRWLFHLGRQLATSGAGSQAADLFRRALSTATPGSPGDPSEEESLRTREDLLLDAMIHLQLARLALDQGDTEGAAERLLSADRTVPRDGRWSIEGETELLTARLELLQGNPARALRRLRRGVLERHRFETVEAYLLVAVAAYEIGDEGQLVEALETARRKGADVSLLARQAPTPVPSVVGKS